MADLIALSAVDEEGRVDWMSNWDAHQGFLGSSERGVMGHSFALSRIMRGLPSMEETQFWGDTHSGVWTRVVSFGSPMTLSWRGRRGGQGKVVAGQLGNVVWISAKRFARS